MTPSTQRPAKEPRPLAHGRGTNPGADDATNNTSQSTDISTAGATTPPLVDLLFDRESPARPAPGMRPPLIWASIGAFFAAILALGVSFGQCTSIIAALILGAAIIPGWPVLFNLANRAVSRVVMAITLVVALPTAYFGSLHTMAVVAAGAILLSFFAEMFRRDGRIHLVEHISASAGGAMLMVATSLWVYVGGVSTGHGYEGSALPVPGIAVGLTIAIAIAVASLIHGFDSPYTSWLGLVNAMVAGTLAALVIQAPVWMGVAAGAVVGLLHGVIRRGLHSFERPLTWVQGFTKSLLPHCVLGVVGYVFTVLLL